MSMFSRDTRPEIAEMLAEGYRRMTPAQRLARVFDLTRAARRMAEAGLRQRYPNATEREVKMRLGALTLGRDLMIKVYGWDPDKEGW